MYKISIADSVQAVDGTATSPGHPSPQWSHLLRLHLACTPCLFLIVLHISEMLSFEKGGIELIQKNYGKAAVPDHNFERLLTFMPLQWFGRLD